MAMCTGMRMVMRMCMCMGVGMCNCMGTCIEMRVGMCVWFISRGWNVLERSGMFWNVLECAQDIGCSGILDRTTFVR